MKTRTVVIILIFTCFGYAMIAYFKMVMMCKTPHLIECVGKRISKDTVYVLTFSKQPSKSVSNDSVMLYMADQGFYGKSDLAFLYFDKALDEFILLNSALVSNPTNRKINDHQFFNLFCHTIDNKGGYFDSNQRINEKTLKRDIKYNTYYGNKKDRLVVKLNSYKSNYYLYYNDLDRAINTIYPLKKGNDTIDVFFNNKNYTKSFSKRIFSFSDIQQQKDSQQFCVTTYISNFRLNGMILNVSADSRTPILKGFNTHFEVNGYLFHVKQKYSIFFGLILLTVLIVILSFSIFLLNEAEKISSPAIRTIYTTRIYLNCIFFLSTPLFVTSYTYVDGRGWFLIMMILLNISLFIPKDIFHFHLSNEKWLYKLIYVAIFLLSVFVIFFTKNEAFLGIPVLHITKVLIVVLLYSLNIHFPQRYNNLKIVFILIYGAIISFLTHDFGTLIYTIIAVGVLEVINGVLKPRQLILSVLGLVVLLIAIYFIFPTIIESRKIYRLYAPYIYPNLATLAHQADRETYASLMYSFKNMLYGQFPLFNEIRVPGEFRSVFHSDYAFFSSILFGRLLFILPFLLVVGLLLKDMFTLLLLSVKSIRISEDKYFTMLVSPESKAVSFLLTITIVQFIYPIFSNSLILPLTGQSVPVLSISIGEIIFLTFILVFLNSTFSNNTKYLSTSNIISRTSLTFKQLNKVINYSLILLLVFFVLFLSLRMYRCSRMPSAMEWEIKEQNKDELNPVCQKVSNTDDKYKLILLADDLTSGNVIDMQKDEKSLLRELAYRFYKGRPMSQKQAELPIFKVGIEKNKSSFIVDSIFSEKRRLISGDSHPFGYVYQFNKEINNKVVTNVSNKYYASIPPFSSTVNADLTAILNKKLESHIKRINTNNIGGIMVIDLYNGNVVVNSCYPLDVNIHSLNTPYLVGSVKKALIAYSALYLDPDIKSRIIEGADFESFIKESSNLYAATLLQNLMSTKRNEFEKVLATDFNLPLHSIYQNAYFDRKIKEDELSLALNKNSIIYRHSIGQQQPYSFTEVMKWYLKIASGRNLTLHYNESTGLQKKLSIGEDDLDFLYKCFNKTLYGGTANSVRISLETNNLNPKYYYAKTGTSEISGNKSNNSSTFLIWNSRYLIGIFLKGVIPANSYKLSAKDLFNNIIPELKNNTILY